jgi:hypothetical protein
MQPGGWQAEDDVTLGDIAARQDLAALHRAHCEPGEIVVARAIKAGHLGRLPADQGTAGLEAPCCDPGHHVDARPGRKLSGCEVVEKEQRLRSLNDEIVHGHRDEIDADRVVYVGFDGDLELGADAVIGGDEDGVVEPAGLEVEQAPETTDLGIGAGSSRGAHQGLDGLDERIARIDVDPCARIGQRCLLTAHVRPHPFLFFFPSAMRPR